MKTNQQLQHDVMEEMRWDPLLSNHAAEIGVSAREGVVTLSGQVDTYSKKLAAEQAALRVVGVKAVAVDVEVRISAASRRTDSDIAELVKNNLLWHTLVNDDLIKATVDNGWIYLEGTAEWDYQKNAAEFAVRDLTGVRGVTNKITVKSRQFDAADIKRRISAAFQRSAIVDASNVEVEASGSSATLRGKVRSWAEKKEAENIAWSAAGITTVNNKIEIDPETLAI